MQLLHENIMMSIKDVNMNANVSLKDILSDNFEVKERKSSNGSLLPMNPVASGDNVTTGLNSAHKLKEELPPLVPCCEGRELQVLSDILRDPYVPNINEDLVRSGLSAISVKHDSVIQCLSMSRACERLQVPPGVVKHRNSFRCLHRPDLKRVPYLRRMTPDELETLFRGYSDLPTRVTKLDSRKETKVLLPPFESNHGKDVINKEPINQSNGTGLRPVPESQSGAEELPAGMQLHGARARLYTSVLASARAGDQLDNVVTNEDYDASITVDPLPEDEVQLNEELQIIMPPRCDDVTAESSTTTSSNS